MAFIAVNARADVQGSKKGKLTPAQNAMMNAWCLSGKTGIFDFGGRCEATPATPSNNASVVTFKDGYFVVCGRLVEVENNTEISVALPLSGETNGYIVARFNLGATGSSEFEVVTKTEDLVRQDLNAYEDIGIYEFPLYGYKATPTGVTLTRDETLYIKSVEDLIKDLKQYTFGLNTSNFIGNGTDFNDFKTEGNYAVTGDGQNIANKPSVQAGVLRVMAGIGAKIDLTATWAYILQLYITRLGEIYIRYFTKDGAIDIWSDWSQVAGGEVIAKRAAYYTLDTGYISPQTIDREFQIARESLLHEKTTRQNQITDINNRLTEMGFKVGSITGWDNSGVTLEKTGKFAILRLPEGEAKNVTSIYTDLQMFIDGTTPLKSAETMTFALNGTNYSATINFTQGSNVARIYSVQVLNGIRPFSIGFKIE